MRNSGLLKWAQNNKNNKNKSANGGAGEEGANAKKWIHSSDTLVQGHVVYLVKVKNV